MAATGVFAALAGAETLHAKHAHTVTGATSGSLVQPGTQQGTPATSGREGEDGEHDSGNDEGGSLYVSPAPRSATGSIGAPSQTPSGAAGSTAAVSGGS